MFQDIAEKIKSIRLHFTVTALLEVVLGVVFLIWARDVMGIFAQFVGAIVIIMGIVEILAKLFEERARAIGILTGLVLVIVGGWIVLHPTGIISIIPIIIGVGLMAHGIQNFSLALAGKSSGAHKWGWMIVMSVVTILLGVVCIVCAVQVVDIAVRVAGVFMILDGLASIFMIHRVNKAERDVDSVITRETDLGDF
ncbi:MAG: DUF308 domain-containing protein [Lachnospiraceae bacterium]|nr:DUF308 domain-containing protein [Lachnospiraceae bacterium]